MSLYLFRLAQAAYHRRRLVLAVWVIVAVATIALAGASGGKTNDVFTIPGTEAQRTTDLLKTKLPVFGGAQTQVVFAAPAGAKITDPDERKAVDASVRNLSHLPQPGSITSPYLAHTVSPNQKVALGTIQFTAQPTDVKDSTLDALKAATAPARAAGIDVQYAGSVYPGWQVKPSELPELVGLIVAFVILLITFGSLVAAGLPILNAVIGVAITLTAVTALASVLTIASASTTVALMLGLACGIDYGLFILLRYRNNLLAGLEGPDAAAQAVGTAGSSVVFAAATVIIALCGLSVVGIPFLTVMGLAAAGSVLVALLIALTLLPAMMGFAGTKVVKFFRLPGRPGHTAEVARRAATEPERTFGSRWGRFVVRRRVPVLVGGVVVLVVLALPIGHIRLGLPSGASRPSSDTSRKAYDLVTDNFGPGYNGALLVAAQPVTKAADAATLAKRLGQEKDVVKSTPLAVQNGVAVIRVIPASGPTDQSTTDLVHRIRDDRSAITAGTGASILVGGTAASNIDVSSKLSSALPEFLAVVVGLAIVLLTFAFRTVLVPLKSVVGFLLSVSAAFGAEVAMFQWGWGKHIFNIVPAETISFLPIIMIAIIFGLSSDYEVFVVSRIKEEHTRTGRARESVQVGLGHAARVVTAAALIMFFIFCAFMITKDPTIKAIGFSFAAGVFLDAFVVRLTLVPALMAVVGNRIWYHPKWFERYIPDPDIEGERLLSRLHGRPSDA